MLSLLSLLLIGFAEPPDLAIAEPPDLAIATKIVDSTVGVHVGNTGGSGTVIAVENGKSLILTCKHVVEHPGLMTIDCGGKTYAAYLLAKDSKYDLALLYANTSLTPVPVADKEPEIGSKVQQYGRAWYGQGKPVYKIGNVIGHMSFTSEDVWASTIDSISGDSGCGVFDLTGQLVAVNWGKPINASGQRAVSLNDIVSFLKKEAKLHFPRLAESLTKRADAKANAKALSKVNVKCKCLDCTCDSPCKCDGDTCACKSCGKPMVSSQQGYELGFFTTPGCTYCVDLENKLKKLKIPYVKYEDVALKSYPVLGVYKDKKLQKSYSGTMSEAELRKLYDTLGK